MKLPRFTTVDGFRLPPSFVPEVFRSSMAYKPEKDAVVVATYPKCGTTWTLQIVSILLRRGKPFTSAEEYFQSTPFLEMTGEEGMQMVIKPYVIKTHLPFDRLNFNPESKYIYVMRHPSDCVVSYYHHIKFFPIYFFSDGSFDDFFELFINDGLDYNDFFNHVLSWYRNKDKPNILLLTFEAMKADPKSAILKIARFLGDEYYDLIVADDEKILKDILTYSSLDYMKRTINAFYRECFADKPPSEKFQEENAVALKYAKLMKEAAENGHHSIGEFIRKGDVGEGKIRLSDEQIQKLNAYIEKKTVDYPDLMKLWK